MATNGVRPPKPANPANQTLHVGNLPDKINKADLRRALYSLFSTHGSVLDIVALKTPRMRGQAHVVFKDTQTSSQAMRALQAFEFFGKEMKISYGKGKSDIISRLDGTARVREVHTGDAVMTDAQKSAFGSAAAVSNKQSIATVADTTMNGTSDTNTSHMHGTKRRRPEDEQEEAEAVVEEDDDDDAMEMEESDDD